MGAICRGTLAGSVRWLPDAPWLGAAPPSARVAALVRSVAPKRSSPDCPGDLRRVTTLSFPDRSTARLRHPRRCDHGGRGAPVEAARVLAVDRRDVRSFRPGPRALRADDEDVRFQRDRARRLRRSAPLHGRRNRRAPSARHRTRSGARRGLDHEPGQHAIGRRHRRSRSRARRRLGAAARVTPGGLSRRR